jgi:hypothetical protein
MNKGRKGRYSKIISAIIMVSVIGLLILAGPAQALILSLDIQDTEAGQGQTITFNGEIEVEAGEYPDIDKIILRLEGPMNVACEFDVNGTIISGCTGLTIQRLTAPTFNYGYGGFDAGNLEYEFTLNTTSYLLGIYQTFLDVSIASVIQETHQGADIEIKSIDLTILSPEEKSYATGVIPITIDSSIEAEYIIYSDNGKPFRTLCRDSEHCTLRIGFDEGPHTLIIRGIYGGTEIEKTINFFVDSLAPKFISSYPQNNQRISTTFNITYTEENLKSIKLLYGTTGNVRQVVKTNCPTGERVICSFADPDLSDFNLQRIDYWFELSDGVNTLTTERRKIIPDIYAPIISVNSPGQGTYQGAWVNFNITTNKLVSEISYTDNVKGTTTRLCTNCDSYGASSRIPKYFNIPGAQNLTFKARDQFGRSTTQEVTFNVI